MGNNILMKVWYMDQLWIGTGNTPKTRVLGFWQYHGKWVEDKSKPKKAFFQFLPYQKWILQSGEMQRRYAVDIFRLITKIGT